MRNKSVVFALFIFLVINAVLFIKYDYDGFYIGSGCLICFSSLPYNITPNEGNGFSFRMIDEEDFEIVGIGFKYRLSDFTIRDILEYGYNDESIILRCKDSIGRIHYLESYPTGTINKKENPEISFRSVRFNKQNYGQDRYRWIKIEEGKSVKIKRLKYLFLFGAFVSFFLLINITIPKSSVSDP